MLTRLDSNCYILYKCIYTKVRICNWYNKDYAYLNMLFILRIYIAPLQETFSEAKLYLFACSESR